VRPGEPVAEVVPRGDRLVVDALVRPADIGFVRVGQTARVKLSAYDYSVFGSLGGKVERVSPDPTVDERTGEAHFVIRVALDAPALTAPGGARLPVGAGMTADVEVEGQSRSVLAYLLTPVTRLRDTAFRER
jgi:adhesin transport system membrane fusion protein